MQQGTMNAIEIPLAQLRPSPANLRAGRSEGRIEALAQSLREEGQKELITVYPGREGGMDVFFVISGVGRLAAAQRAGLASLAARVDANLGQAGDLALVKACQLHNDTEQGTPLDRALAAQYLRGKGHSWREVANALGETENAVRRLQAFFELPLAILELGKTNPQRFLASFAELMKRELPAIGEEKMLALFAQALEEGWSLREFKARVAAEKTRAAKRGQGRARQTSAQAFALGGGVDGQLRMWQTPGRKVRLRFAAGGLGNEVGMHLLTRLSALLEEFAEAVHEGKGL
jgi:ParB family chromosome partitioning protein